MITKLGRIGIFVFQSIIGIFPHFIYKNKLTKKTFINYLYSIGVSSIPLVFIVSLFTGMVLIVQLIPGFKQFGAESMEEVFIQLARG